MSRATLSGVAEEGSTYIIRATWYDEDDTAVTPNTATWTLTNGDGIVVNSREDETIATPSTYNDIVLGADDLRCSSNRDETRVLITEYTYDSDAGADLPGTAQVSFMVQRIQTVVHR